MKYTYSEKDVRIKIFSFTRGKFIVCVILLIGNTISKYETERMRDRERERERERGRE